MSVSSHDNGDIYHCTMNLTVPNETFSDTSVDIFPPEFNFAWTSSPLNVECEYNVIFCVVIMSFPDFLAESFFGAFGCCHHCCRVANDP